MAKFAIPWTGKYNSRIQKTNYVSGSSAIAGVAIAGVAIAGRSAQTTDKDERWINAMLTDMGGRLYAIKRPGRAALNTPSAGNIGSAIMIWTGYSGGTDILTAFGATNSTVYNSTTSLGAITGKARSIIETLVSTTPMILVASGDSTGWYYDAGVSVAVMTQITDAQFPGQAGFTTAGDFAPIDGFNCIMTTDGKLWASDLNSVTAWTANNYDVTNSYPDKGVGCVRFRSLMMAFGKESVEFWQNAGLSPFPLQRVKSMTQRVGAVSSDAIATLADNVFWCGAPDKGGLSIFQYDGTLSRISTPDIDGQLNLVGPDTISLTTERKYGRSFVRVTANATTLVYCLEDKRWHQETAQTRLGYKCAGPSSGSQILSYSISNVDTGGKVYVINPANLVFTDDSVAFTSSIQSANDDQDSPYSKDYPYLAAMHDIEPSESLMNVYYSDDDYVTWTLAGTWDFSQAKQYLTALGTSPRQRAWKLTHASNAAFRLSRVMGEVKVGTT